MIALIQRVLRAQVDVDERTIGVQRGDTRTSADRLLERIVTYRIFADEAGRMNRSLADARGGLLLVPQFTLAADTHQGTRPGFSTAAEPSDARALFDWLLARARERHSPVAAGEFGAHMRVSLVNDGPVTFWLQVAPG